MADYEPTDTTVERHRILLRARDERPVGDYYAAEIDQIVLATVSA
jgi:hypothetical protein